MFKKNLHLWLPNYLTHIFRNKSIPKRPVHILFTIADHFEPRWNNPSIDIEFERVDRWHKLYPAFVKEFKDADGFHPLHTFFFPEEEYRFEHLNKLADLERRKFGEVEIHLHHDNDTPENLKKTLNNFKNILLKKHGLLSTCSGNVGYAFIHGNWALDNSRPDGGSCGVNNEISILKETGCFADFTMPSAPDITQTSTINSIYYAKGKEGCSKSHDKGRRVKVGEMPGENDLLMIQGPLALNMKKRKFGILPGIENGEISYDNPPTPDRVDSWIKSGVCVKGREEWVFVKVYTHGAQEKNIDLFFSESLIDMHNYLRSEYNDGANWKLHYVTAREMYNITMAAIDGEEGDPGRFRNYIFKKSL